MGTDVFGSVKFMINEDSICLPLERNINFSLRTYVSTYISKITRQPQT